MGLHVGTSGWAYREWKPAFYPADLPQARFLEHYAAVLTACEINATFYRLQSERALTGWAEAAPEGFRFALKAHRGLTHGALFPPDRAEDGLLARFMASARLLGPRLGCILVQLPPTRRRDDRALDALLGALDGGPAFAIEFRDESWEAPEVAERVAAAGGTVCTADRDASTPERLPPGPIAYVRLRADRYDDHARERWRDLLEREAGEREVFAFAKHEGVPAGDPHVGVGLAQWLVSATRA
jgi:uncharacterized protein YecE (DUF72 family)